MFRPNTATFFAAQLKLDKLAVGVPLPTCWRTPSTASKPCCGWAKKSRVFF